jgi:sugar (pentulose or hexulose) kinase
MVPSDGRPSHQPNNHVSPIYIGIDAGTSGIRACAINKNGDILASRSLGLPLPEHTDEGGVQQDPAIWRNTLMAVMQQMAQDIDLETVAALGIDGTSGTVMLVNEHDEPLTPALMYNDARAYNEVKQLKEIAPASSPVHAV